MGIGFEPERQDQNAMGRCRDRPPAGQASILPQPLASGTEHGDGLVLVDSRRTDRRRSRIIWGKMASMTSSGIMDGMFPREWHETSVRSAA
jgi:hypothetical protein